MQCPDCGGEMWDNRTNKKNPKAPDYRCKDQDCAKAVWLPKEKPAEKVEKPKDEYVEGKKENSRLICRTNLMTSLVNHWGETQTDKDLCVMFDALWAKIEG